MPKVKCDQAISKMILRNPVHHFIRDLKQTTTLSADLELMKLFMKHNIGFLDKSCGLAARVTPGSRLTEPTVRGAVGISVCYRFENNLTLARLHVLEAVSCE